MLTLQGSYADNVGSLAKIGIRIASISDRDEWQPKSVIVASFPDSVFSVLANPPGYFYMPLVYIDRLTVHPTKKAKFH